MNRQIQHIIKLSLGPIIASVFIFFPEFKIFSAQYTALLSIVLTLRFIRYRKISLPALSGLVSTIVFSTGGLSSPFFFLSYFFIFSLALLNPPSTSLSFSLVYTLVLINSLDSFYSSLSLISIPLIVPIAYYIGKLHLANQQKQTIININQDQISHHEKNFFIWFSLTLKHKLNSSLDILSQLLSNPGLTYSQKQLLKKLKINNKSILKTATSLARDIDTKTDD